MLTETLKALFAKDLDRLRKEIESYKDEKVMWSVQKNIPNSAGNLCLHLIGNLNHYIGAGIGKTSYIRQRDLEFSLKDIPKRELIQRIEKTKTVVETALDKLSESDLEAEYPEVVFEKKSTVQYLLVQLSTHLTYHLGQINYHRRLLD